MAKEPGWLSRARSFLGLKEYPGAANNPTILGWLTKLKASWRDDLTPWCGTFVATVFTDTGYTPVNGWAGARNWLKFGIGIADPVVGCVVVFSRPGSSWSGHVGFVVGRDKLGNLMVLGGNQGDAVTIKPFSKSRVLGYRWPANVVLPADKTLPLLNSSGRPSTDEA